MAINKKLIHFKNKENFNTEVANGNILNTSIVFILDTQEIYTHGLFYDGSKIDLSGIEASILNIIDTYATKTEIPTKLSQLENDINYLQDDINYPNGVYAVDANGKLIDYNTADTTATGVALVAGEHKFMIAKKDATDGTNTSLYWSKNLYQKDVAGVVTNGNADGTNSSGYLPKSDGSYQSTPNLSGDFTTWTAGALAEFNGAANTAAIIAGYTEHGVSMETRDMCSVLNTFNTSDSYKDWYVPACGQLALMYLNMTEINAALDKIGGTALAAVYYWSSSECSSNNAWSLGFGNGCVGYDLKGGGLRRVRFVRDISVKSLKERVSELENKLLDKQDTLVSGISIKTINGESILGEGNLTVTTEANIQAVDTTDEIEDVETNTYVKYVALTLTDELKALVRENIGVNNQDTVDLSNYYTKEEIDSLLGDINTILESIING